MSGKTFLHTLGIDLASDQPANGATSETVLSLSVPMLEPDPGQPRKHFDEQELQELAESLKLHGQLQPILVRRAAVAGRYQIVAGERRWRACRLAGIDRIRAIEVQEREGGGFIREAQLVENLHRANMSAIETAEAYRSLMLAWGVSMAEVARRLGVDKSTVSRALALLQSPEETRERVAAGESVRRATGTERVSKKRKPPAGDKRRALVLELTTGTVRVKRGHTVEELVEELRRTLDQRAREAA